MPLHPTWQDIAVRLICALIASALIGLDREARGHAAGFRTTILVGLAAAVAMIQANILLSVGGKTPDSFGVMDLMRLPLGILTGVGFIGAGAILRRGDLTSGVTTAATLWAVTVIGLCMGGGQIALGWATTVLGLGTLLALKWIDERIPRVHRGKLVIVSDAAGTPFPDIAAVLGDGCRARFLHQERSSEGQRLSAYEVRWKRPAIAGAPADLLARIEAAYRIRSFEIL